MSQSVCKKPKNSWKRKLFILSFIIIPTVNFIVFYVYPNLDSFIMGFQRIEDGKSYFTLDNFRNFFREFKNPTEGGLPEAFRNTAKTFLVKEIMFPVSFAVSYFLYKKIFMHRFFRVVFFLPSIVAGTIITSVFTRFVSVEGPVALIVKALYGLDYVPDLLGQSRYANGVVLANMVWLSFPGSMIIWGGALSRVPEQVLESARLDGVNLWQEAVRIIIPMIWPMFALQLLLSVIDFFGSSGQVFLLTQGKYGTMTLSCWMYLQVYHNVGAGYSNAYNYMAAVGLILSAVSIALSVTLRKITRMNAFDSTY